MSDADKTVCRDFEEPADLYGTLKQLCSEYSRVVVNWQWRENARHEDREVEPDALELREKSVDITGYPATGRFMSPNEVHYVKAYE